MQPLCLGPPLYPCSFAAYRDCHIRRPLKCLFSLPLRCLQFACAVCSRGCFIPRYYAEFYCMGISTYPLLQYRTFGLLPAWGDYEWGCYKHLWTRFWMSIKVISLGVVLRIVTVLQYNGHMFIFLRSDQTLSTVVGEPCTLAPGSGSPNGWRGSWVCTAA